MRHWFKNNFSRGALEEGGEFGFVFAPTPYSSRAGGCGLVTDFFEDAKFQGLAPGPFRTGFI